VRPTEAAGEARPAGGGATRSGVGACAERGGEDRRGAEERPAAEHLCRPEQAGARAAKWGVSGEASRRGALGGLQYTILVLPECEVIVVLATCWSGRLTSSLHFQMRALRPQRRDLSRQKTQYSDNF
jgi:hypothetical protein